MDLASLLESLKPQGVDEEHARWVADRDHYASMPRAQRYAGMGERAEVRDLKREKDFWALMARLRATGSPMPAAAVPQPGSLQAILNAMRSQPPGLHR